MCSVTQNVYCLVTEAKDDEVSDCVYYCSCCFRFIIDMHCMSGTSRSMHSNFNTDMDLLPYLCVHFSFQTLMALSLKSWFRLVHLEVWACPKLHKLTACANCALQQNAGSVTVMCTSRGQNVRR